MPHGVRWEAVTCLLSYVMKYIQSASAVGELNLIRCIPVFDVAPTYLHESPQVFSVWADTQRRLDKLAY